MRSIELLSQVDIIGARGRGEAFGYSLEIYCRRLSPECFIPTSIYVEHAIDYQMKQEARRKK
ncbi:MAG: hypothetical protein HC849_10905 [Oscillatoriales cyanobacterium RU_3_3]|nr:hypothetical protein [Microcoleus sp. SU_5_6]NJM60588.1 hypothetical protein [Oscillatoriales cyanobacterium RU_3_3]NJR24614.1 hypothetical protein [Richelia sp. CSU_2_1]